VGHQEDFAAKNCADALRNLVAVENGQSHVHKRNRRATRQGFVDPLDAIFGYVDVVPQQLQQRPQGLPAVLIVLDNEDAQTP
jgi:hypothetical protein